MNIEDLKSKNKILRELAEILNTDPDNVLETIKKVKKEMENFEIEMKKL